METKIKDEEVIEYIQRLGYSNIRLSSAKKKSGGLCFCSKQGVKLEIQSIDQQHIILQAKAFLLAGLIIPDQFL